MLIGVFGGVVYASTKVPDANSVQNAQTTTLYYADGTSVMGRMGSENRTNVALKQVSEPARFAVLSAENRSFYTDPGISFTGIVRAAWNSLTGSSTQGGSTITQQYVKNAFLSSEQTFTRKFKELFLAVKLDNSYSKDQILENYLNTIYFGRGAYGIEAAATTYFGVHAAQLTPQQGAVLAVLIRSPSYYDPTENPKPAEEKWGLVLDGMVKKGWLSPADRAASAYPKVLPRTGSSLGTPKGPEGLIVQRAIDELTSKGYTEQQVRAGGLRITTTVEKKAQDAAITAVNDVMKGQPEALRQALVAVDPRTGAVVAYYGGASGTGQDYASNSYRPPGSSMKPYVLAAGLQQGIGVYARRDAPASKVFPDRPKPVTNSGGEACASCTLVQSMTESLNTAFYGLALEVGPNKVRKTALAAMDLPDTWAGGPLKGQKILSQNGDTGGAIGIGQYEVRPIDQAHGFATLAVGGVQREPYFVAKVTDPEGKVMQQNTGSAGRPAMSADVAHDVTLALEGVAARSKRALAGNRPVASKTGTQGLNEEENSDAWMVGYTPSLSAAVWMGTDSVQGIRNSSGAIVYGSGLPGAIWQQFMNLALRGTPVEKLPDAPIIQGDTGNSVPEVVVPPPPPPVPSAVPVPTQAPVAAPTTTAPAPVTTSSTTASPKAPTKSPVTSTPSTTAPAPTSAALSGEPNVPSSDAASRTR